MTPYYERDGITIYCGDCLLSALRSKNAGVKWRRNDLPRIYCRLRQGPCPAWPSLSSNR